MMEAGAADMVYEAGRNHEYQDGRRDVEGDRKKLKIGMNLWRAKAVFLAMCQKEKAASRERRSIWCRIKAAFIL